MTEILKEIIKKYRSIYGKDSLYNKLVTKYKMLKGGISDNEQIKPRKSSELLARLRKKRRMREVGTKEFIDRNKDKSVSKSIHNIENLIKKSVSQISVDALRNKLNKLIINNEF